MYFIWVNLEAYETITNLEVKLDQNETKVYELSRLNQLLESNLRESRDNYNSIIDQLKDEIEEFKIKWAELTKTKQVLKWYVYINLWLLIKYDYLSNYFELLIF